MRNPGRIAVVTDPTHEHQWAISPRQEPSPRQALSLNQIEWDNARMPDRVNEFNSVLKKKA